MGGSPRSNGPLAFMQRSQFRRDDVFPQTSPRPFVLGDAINDFRRGGDRWSAARGHLRAGGRPIARSFRPTSRRRRLRSACACTLARPKRKHTDDLPLHLGRAADAAACAPRTAACRMHPCNVSPLHAPLHTLVRTFRRPVVDRRGHALPKPISDLNGLVPGLQHSVGQSAHEAPGARELLVDMHKLPLSLSQCGFGASADVNPPIAERPQSRSPSPDRSTPAIA